MPYRINPDADRPYIEEFRQNPIGRHSPGLRRVLNTLRFDPSGKQLVLVCKTPFKRWVLGEMPASRDEPMRIEGGLEFHSREEAEWAVFCRRWRALTGEAINLTLDLGKA